MKPWFLLLVAGVASAAPPIAIRDVTIIDAASRPRRGTVVVRGHRIAEVGAVAVPAGATVIDGRGKFVIPGLWDAHIHLVDVDDVAFGVLVAHGV
ncbi:MAG TPA: hypothetical protein VLM79_23855, partial [Kofleriaceae bacterium]|nr:hypothetical protein [Kofleriaceae bacterium]